MRNLTKRLAFKLIVSILAATALLLFGILYNNYRVSKKLLLESARETAYQLTNATMTRMESVLISAQRVPEGMTLFLKEKNVTEMSLLDMLGFILSNKPEVFGSAVAFAPHEFDRETENYAPYCYRSDDRMVYKNLADDNYRYYEQDWYVLAKDSAHALWTEPYFDKGGGNVMMATYAVPFYKEINGEKMFRGVVTSDISLKWLEDMMSAIKVFKTGYVIMISQNGTIITHPVRDHLMRNLYDIATEAGNEELQDIALQLKQQKEGYFPFTSLIDGRPCWFYYTTLPQTSWHMAVVIPEDELFAGLQQLYTYTIFIGILGILLLSLVVILFSARTTRPLMRLTETAHEIGSGNLDVKIGEDRSSLEIAMLGNAFNRMQAELKEYIRNLEVTTAARERMESELNIASSIQLGMIPKVFPPFPDRSDIDIYAWLKPARQVGGDLYDFFFLDEDNICFAIGDVSDKGVPAALMMAMTITLFRAKMDIARPVGEIAASINREISRENENMMFVTFFMGIINTRTGMMSYCNAGHNYPFILDDDGSLVRLDQTHGVPFGINGDMPYGSSEIRLAKPCRLILFTDGISEAVSIDKEFYGDDRLTELIRRRCKGLSASRITEKIKDDVAAFTRNPEQSDDITLMVIKFQ